MTTNTEGLRLTEDRDLRKVAAAEMWPVELTRQSALDLFRALARALEMEGMTVEEAIAIGEDRCVLAAGEYEHNTLSGEAARVLRAVTGE